MNDTAIQNSLFRRFETLNTFSGIQFITQGNANVAYPNIDFEPPANKRWFELFFLPDKPEGLGVCDNHLDRWTGIFQIDICTPKNKGEDEANNKYRWIAKLFARGTTFDDVLIDKVYKIRKEEDNVYRTIVRIEWEADIDNSEE